MCDSRGNCGLGCRETAKSRAAVEKTESSLFLRGSGSPLWAVFDTYRVKIPSVALLMFRQNGRGRTLRTDRFRGLHLVLHYRNSFACKVLQGDRSVCH